MTGRSEEGARERALLRRSLSYVGYSGLVPPPVVLRPRGVSAITLARNEEDWAETSIQSVLPYVDEILVADNRSDDGTRDILRNVAADSPDVVKFVPLPDEGFVESTNLLISLTKYRWILRWHADFIARGRGIESVPALLDASKAMSPGRHVSVAISGIALDGDLEHQFRGLRDAPEPFLFTYSPWIRYYVKDRWESLGIPWFYEKTAWPGAPYFHMRSVKSPERLLQKLYWSRWFEARNRGSSESLRSFIARNATAEFKVASLDEAARLYEVQEFQECVPFRRDICGDYPDALLPFLEHPPYKLVLKAGKVVGRVASDRQMTSGEG